MGEVESKALVAPQAALDISFIQRNIRDLSKTAEFSHMSELEELHQMAYVNLKKQLAPGKPLAEDPSLALEAYKTLSGVVMQIVETKRKAADTLIKARTLIDVPDVDRGGLLDEEDDLPEEAIAEASVSESGIFGKLVNHDTGQDEDPKIDMAV